MQIYLFLQYRKVVFWLIGMVEATIEANPTQLHNGMYIISKEW
jgi:hypothetical protein